MAGTIASLLADFSQPVAGEPRGIQLLRMVKAEPQPAHSPQQQPVVDHQAELVRSVEARVRAEEREIADKRLEEALAAERARHREELDSQRVIWVEQQAVQMSAQISEAFGRMEASLTEKVANILGPFVSDAFRHQSLAELKEVLDVLLSRHEGAPIRISGPADLLSAMEAHLASHRGGIEYLPGDHVEMSVTVQDTLVQTQLDSWSLRLKRALES